MGIELSKIDFYNRLWAKKILCIASDRKMDYWEEKVDQIS